MTLPSPQPVDFSGKFRKIPIAQRFRDFHHFGGDGGIRTPETSLKSLEFPSFLFSITNFIRILHIKQPHLVNILVLFTLGKLAINPLDCLEI